MSLCEVGKISEKPYAFHRPRESINTHKVNSVHNPATASKNESGNNDRLIENTSDDRPVRDDEVDVIHTELTIKLTRFEELTEAIVDEGDVWGRKVCCVAGKGIANKVGLPTCPREDEGCSEAKPVGASNLSIGGFGHDKKELNLLNGLDRNNNIFNSH